MSQHYSKIFTISFIALSLLSFQTKAQNNDLFQGLIFKTENSTEVYEYVVETSSGSQIQGELLGIKFGKLQMLTKELGTLEVALDDIKNIKPYADNVGPSIKYQEQQRALAIEEREYTHIVGSNHYFLSPSSFGPRKGESQFQVTYLFFLSATYGISDNFSITGGISVIPAVSLNNQLFYVIPKVSLPVTKNIRLGAQFTYFTVLDDDLGLLSLTSTFGKEDKNLTVGISYGWINNELVEIPLVNVAAVIRVSRKIALLTDNFIGTRNVGESGSIVTSFGVRILSGDSAFDLGVWSIQDTNVRTIPFLNYTLRF